MMLDDQDSPYEISPLNRIKDEYPFFIIEIAGEPIPRERKKMPSHNIFCCQVPPVLGQQFSIWKILHLQLE
jgi:hypothetical protein